MKKFVLRKAYWLQAPILLAGGLLTISLSAGFYIGMFVGAIAHEFKIILAAVGAASLAVFPIMGAINFISWQNIARKAHP